MGGWRRGRRWGEGGGGGDGGRTDGGRRCGRAAAPHVTLLRTCSGPCCPSQDCGSHPPLPSHAQRHRPQAPGHAAGPHLRPHQGKGVSRDGGVRRDMHRFRSGGMGLFTGMGGLGIAREPAGRCGWGPEAHLRRHSPLHAQLSRPAAGSSGVGAHAKRWIWHSRSVCNRGQLPWHSLAQDFVAVNQPRRRDGGLRGASGRSTTRTLKQADQKIMVMYMYFTSVHQHSSIVASPFRPRTAATLGKNADTDNPPWIGSAGPAAWKNSPATEPRAHPPLPLPRAPAPRDRRPFSACFHINDNLRHHSWTYPAVGGTAQGTPCT